MVKALQIRTMYLHAVFSRVFIHKLFPLEMHHTNTEKVARLIKTELIK